MSRQEKERFALTAAYEYLSKKQRETLMTIGIPRVDIREAYKAVRFCCMIAGVQGYWPVRVLTRLVLQKAYPGKFQLKN